MIVVGRSQAPAQARRRAYPEGLLPEGVAGNWITGYMGRELRDPTKPVANPVVPTRDQIYPMAYLVEQDANASLRPHFHIADQFQVFVEGDGRLGTTPIDHVSLHFVSPYSAYGPIESGPRGIHYITLRNRFDPGSRFMPESSKELPRPRQYRQVMGGPLKPLQATELASLTESFRAVLVAPEDDGLGAWHYRLPPGGSITGPDPTGGDGQHWLVLGGGLDWDGQTLERNSCVFVSSDEAALLAKAGAQGLEMLVLQYPKRYFQQR
jgi:hypothetical protein